MGVVKILQNELGEFYINYVICELSWVLSHMIQTVRFYINYVICELSSRDKNVSRVTKFYINYVICELLLV